MKTIKPLKRSVSPFVLAGDVTPANDLTPFETALLELQNASLSALGPVTEEKPTAIKAIEDFNALPGMLRDLAEAPANDAPKLSELCAAVVRFQETLQKKGLAEAVDRALAEFFLKKIELFMVDHYDEEHCKKMGWAVSHKDIVLFAKERDVLIGSYFAPLADAKPGRFSEFVSKWIESPNQDRLLHFLDFCAGSKNPTFEHYLLFSHPALGRILRDKSLLKSLFDKTSTLLKKVKSPTWEKETKTALGL